MRWSTLERSWQGRPQHNNNTGSASWGRDEGDGILDITSSLPPPRSLFLQINPALQSLVEFRHTCVRSMGCTRFLLVGYRGLKAVLRHRKSEVRGSRAIWCTPLPPASTPAGASSTTSGRPGPADGPRAGCPPRIGQPCGRTTPGWISESIESTESIRLAALSTLVGACPRGVLPERALSRPRGAWSGLQP